MQVIIDADYIDLFTNSGEVKSKHEGEYNPFTGKKVQTISMENIKKLVSLPKEERQELMTQLKGDYSKRS